MVGCMTYRAPLLVLTQQYFALLLQNVRLKVEVKKWRMLLDAKITNIR